MKKKKKAFTLAETLITLAIIGVIAALAIPGLITNIQNQGYITSLQKAVAVGNAALQKAALDNCGTTDLSCLFNGNLITIGDAIAAQYNVSKNCQISTGAAGSSCFASYDSYFDGNSGGALIDYGAQSAYYKFITAEGMSVFIGQGGNLNCTENLGLNLNSPTTKTCGRFFVDINGLKGPNYLGRDVFRFYITSNKAPFLYPSGGREDNYSRAGNDTTGGDLWWNYNNWNLCSSSSRSGYFCSARIIEKGWKMDY